MTRINKKITSSNTIPFPMTFRDTEIGLANKSNLHHTVAKESFIYFDIGMVTFRV